MPVKKNSAKTSGRSCDNVALQSQGTRQGGIRIHRAGMLELHDSMCRGSTSCLRGSKGSLSLMRKRHMEATRNSNSLTRGVSPPSGPTCTPTHVCTHDLPLQLQVCALRCTKGMQVNQERKLLNRLQITNAMPAQGRMDAATAQHIYMYYIYICMLSCILYTCMNIYR